MGNVTERELLVRRPYEIMSLFSGKSWHIAEHAGCGEAPRGPTGGWISCDGLSSSSSHRPSPFAHLEVDCFA